MLQTIENFIYKIPIVLLFGVPVILILMLVVGPIFRRVRYNWVGLVIVIAAIAAVGYFIAVRLDAFR